MKHTGVVDFGRAPALIKYFKQNTSSDHFSNRVFYSPVFFRPRHFWPSVFPYLNSYRTAKNYRKS